LSVATLINIVLCELGLILNLVDMQLKFCALCALPSTELDTAEQGQDQNETYQNPWPPEELKSDNAC
jgi:hypothetical protein